MTDCVCRYVVWHDLNFNLAAAALVSCFIFSSSVHLFVGKILYLTWREGLGCFR